MTSFPKIIKIGGILFRVFLRKGLMDASGGRKLDGMVPAGESKILIDEDLSIQFKVETLLHEIVHEAAAHLGHPRLSEPVVDAIAYMALQLMRDNPGLLQLILEFSKVKT